MAYNGGGRDKKYTRRNKETITNGFLLIFLLITNFVLVRLS